MYVCHNLVDWNPDPELFWFTWTKYPPAESATWVPKPWRSWIRGGDKWNNTNYAVKCTVMLCYKMRKTPWSQSNVNQFRDSKTSACPFRTATSTSTMHCTVICDCMRLLKRETSCDLTIKVTYLKWYYASSFGFLSYWWKDAKCVCKRYTHRQATLFSHSPV